MTSKRRVRRAADLLSVANIPVRQAAAVLAREPESPVAQAIRLWGDDEEPFKNLINARTPPARQWRRVVARIIANLECDRSGQSAYRGWSFTSARRRADFMRPVLAHGFFINPRVGMSATQALAIATRAPFLNRRGAIWEIRRPRTARNVEAIFAAVGAKYPDQREVIFPRDSCFVLAEPPRRLKLVRGRQILRVPYLVFEEV